MWNATFRLLTASLLQAMGSTGCHAKERQKQIFEKLLLEQKAASKLTSTPKVDQANWVINWSSRTLSDAETTLLKKGLNFAVTPTNIRTTEIIAKVETTIRPLDTEQADTVRRTVNNLLQKDVPPKPNITAEMRNALKSLKQDHSIMILPADRLSDCSPRHGNGYHSKMPMISFNVESLFNNVSIEETVQAALHRLNNDPSLPDRTALTPTQIADLLNFVLRSTYFKYNGALYEQQDGAPMGSSISAVIADLYMEAFEEQTLATAPKPPRK